MGRFKSFNLLPIQYSLQSYHRSNQDTTLVHKPLVKEGDWVQSGDLLSDCSASVQGEFSIGHNILIAYLPWEGYNYEDAILISERLVYDDLYTSIHIERYDISIEKTPYGNEQITKNISLLKDTNELNHLDKNGIAQLGSWLKEGDILVGKITPLESKKDVARYVQLYNEILGKNIDYSVRDTSLRVPRGLEAKVIKIQTFPVQEKTLNKGESVYSFLGRSIRLKKGFNVRRIGFNSPIKTNLPIGFNPPFSRIQLHSLATQKVLAQKLKKHAMNHRSKTKKRALKDRNFSLVKHWREYSFIGRTRSFRASYNMKNKLKKLFLKSFLSNFIFNKIQNKLDKKKSKSKQIKTKEIGKISFRFFDFSKYFKFQNLPLKKSSDFLLESSTFILRNSDFSKKRNSIKKKNHVLTIPNSDVIPGKFLYKSTGNKNKIELRFLKTKAPLLFWKQKGFFGKSSFLSEGRINHFLLTRKSSFPSLREMLKQKSKSIKKNIDVITSVHVYLAEKRKVQVGDKMAGRHGNKGIISQILPRQDMPYLPDGTPIDMALNPLGVPSRMNVGQIYECLLGLAGKHLGEQYRIKPFDESFGSEASRSFVFSKLYEAKLKTGQSWIFQPSNPGKFKFYDGRTGNGFDQPLTGGYSYMIKLVHLVDDKLHCLTPDHEVLTTDGWLPISQVTTSHVVATLQKGGQLVYQKPTHIYNYPTFKGRLYEIKNTNLDLCVTLNHRMYVKQGSGQSFENYEFIPAKDIIGKHKKYLKTALWGKNDYQFILPSIKIDSVCIPEKPVHMKSWLQFFGIWIAEGFVLTHMNAVENSDVRRNSTDSRDVYFVQVVQRKQQVIDILEKVVQGLGYNYTLNPARDKLTIHQKQLWTYLRSLSVISPRKRLPDWVWELSQTQARILLESMLLGDGISCRRSNIYYTSSMGLADDVMRLALHAGWSGNKSLYVRKALVVTSKSDEGSNKNKENPTFITDYGDRFSFIGFSFPSNSKNFGDSSNEYIWRISIIKNKNFPSVNHSQIFKAQKERVLEYEGPVHCLSVPNEVFYVRRNGLPIWTGNSRSTGPYSLITQQPLKGRSKHGGQRLGEMEVWAIEAYGAAFTLLELLTIKSDDVTGRLTIWDYILYKKPLYIGTPASFKVMVCELQALCLDIGIYKADNFNSLKQIHISTMG